MIPATVVAIAVTITLRFFMVLAFSNNQVVGRHEAPKNAGSERNRALDSEVGMKIFSMNGFIMPFFGN